MKYIINSILITASILLQIPVIQAQTTKMVVSDGHLIIASNTELRLVDTDLAMNGTLTTGDGSKLVFGGNASDTVSISGTNNVTLYELEINRSNSGLRLDRGITVDSVVTCTAGLIELNGNTLFLSEGAVLANESSSSYVVGTPGGVVSTTVNLANPAADLNPGQLGISLTTPIALGVTTIHRGNVGQVVDTDTSILRYYEVIPTNNSNLNATVDIAYFDHELNGITETGMDVANFDSTFLELITPDSASITSNTVSISGLDSFSILTLVAGGLKISPVVLLQGPYNSGGIMDSKLNELNLIPTSEPYTGLGYTHVGGGEEVVKTQVFDQTGNDAVVDWIFLELLDAVDFSTVVATRSALLLANGAIVDVDGSSPVNFRNVDNGNYYIKIRHRNHLGIQSMATINLSSTTTISYDFTSASIQARGTDPMTEVSPGAWAMWGGNAKSDDDYVRVTPRVFPPPSLASDRTYILDNILNGDPNGTFNGYSTGDINMDGYVRLTPRVFPPPSLDSDATFILDEVLGGDPNATRTEQ